MSSADHLAAEEIGKRENARANVHSNRPPASCGLDGKSSASFHLNQVKLYNLFKQYNEACRSHLNGDGWPQF